MSRSNIFFCKDGIDGLGGIHGTHPHLTPTETWKHLFGASKLSDPAVAEELEDHSGRLFRPSNAPAHEEMLRLLRESEEDTITIVAVGPLTNLALAAAQEPETFLRAKEVVVMGGTLDEVGNVCHLLSSSQPRWPKLTIPSTDHTCR